MPLVSEGDLLGGERRDVSRIVGSFHDNCVASVGKSSCIQRVLKSGVGRCSRLRIDYVSAGESICGRGDPAAVNEHIDTRNAGKSPSPTGNVCISPEGVAGLREVEEPIRRQWARARLLAV